jgi:hypothetical protein
VGQNQVADLDQPRGQIQSAVDTNRQRLTCLQQRGPKNRFLSAFMPDRALSAENPEPGGPPLYQAASMGCVAKDATCPELPF